MNKKGMLLASETLKIIIGVICIGFLIYLLVAVYFSNANSQYKEAAESILTTMEEVFPDLNSTNPTYNISGVTPPGWTIFSYTDMEKKPNSCAGKNCICICDEVTVDLFDAQLKKCTDKGACLIQDLLLENPDIEIKKDGTTNIEIYKKDTWSGVRLK